MERGQRGFNRRGLIEDPAALGRSVTDLTEQPYLPLDRGTGTLWRLSLRSRPCEPEADSTGSDVRAAEALGMIHLFAAPFVDGDGHPGAADTHIAEATDLEHFAGERNTLVWHFGPVNVAAWSLVIAVERGGAQAMLRDSTPTWSDLCLRDGAAGYTWTSPAATRK